VGALSNCSRVQFLRLSGSWTDASLRFHVAATNRWVACDLCWELRTSLPVPRLHHPRSLVLASAFARFRFRPLTMSWQSLRRPSVAGAAAAPAFPSLGPSHFLLLCTAWACPFSRSICQSTLCLCSFCCAHPCRLPGSARSLTPSPHRCSLLRFFSCRPQRRRQGAPAVSRSSARQD
jgi:hypothetical protein